MHNQSQEPQFISLAESKRNAVFTICKFDGGPHFAKKLESIGIREGDTIVVMNKHVLKGPIVVKVKNAQIALGYMMAKKIWGTVK